MSDLALQKPSYLANLNPLDNDFKPEIGDIKIPNIILSQPAGDVLKEENEGYIPNLRAGQFFNSSTRQIYGKVLHLIYVHHFKVFPVYKVNGQNREWEETLALNQFEALKGRVYSKEAHGILSPDRADRVIGEHWKFVVINADDPSFDFMYLTIKEGGLSDAKMWYNKIFTAWRGNEPAGIAAQNPLTLVWEIPSYLKESKSNNSTSYQINGNLTKISNYANEGQYNVARSTKESIATLIPQESNGEY